MTGAVIDLDSRRPETMIWRCNCGTVSFNLYEDGRIECCGCHEFQITKLGEWIIPGERTAEVTPFEMRVCSVCGSQHHRAASCPKRPGTETQGA